MSSKLKKHPADTFCRGLINRYPKSPEYADMVFRDRTIIKGEFPDWCALPTSFVASIIAGSNDRQTILYMQRQEIVYQLTAALIWARNKMIYRFDDTLADTLAAQSLDSKIPSEVLEYLPYPCVYIERKMTIEGHETIGFFAWLDWGTKENKKLLQMAFMQQNNKSMLICLPISGGTITDSILEMANRHPGVSKKFTEDDVHNFPTAKLIVECLNLLLYLCSEKPDMPDDTESRIRRSRDAYGNPKRFATWEVGTRIGAALRKAMKQDAENEDETNKPDTENEAIAHKTARSSPRPHMRRAHWQSFWTGKRGSSERKLILRWIPPIAVNIDDTDLPTVIRPVER